MWPYLPLLIPILALMIPIVAILAHHQQKMAAIVHQSRGGSDIEALRAEIRELKALIHQQAIALDNLASGRARQPSAEPLEERLGVGA